MLELGGLAVRGQPAHHAQNLRLAVADDSAAIDPVDRLNRRQHTIPNKPKKPDKPTK